MLLHRRQLSTDELEDNLKGPYTYIYRQKFAAMDGKRLQAPPPELNSFTGQNFVSSDEELML